MWQGRPHPVGSSLLFVLSSEDWRTETILCRGTGLWWSARWSGPRAVVVRNPFMRYVLLGRDSVGASGIGVPSVPFLSVFSGVVRVGWSVCSNVLHLNVAALCR